MIRMDVARIGVRPLKRRSRVVANLFLVFLWGVWHVIRLAFYIVREGHLMPNGYWPPNKPNRQTNFPTIALHLTSQLAKSIFFFQIPIECWQLALNQLGLWDWHMPSRYLRQDAEGFWYRFLERAPSFLIAWATKATWQSTGLAQPVQEFVRRLQLA